MTPERLPEVRLRHRAELQQRAVAAAVLDRRARFEASHADRVEREVRHELGGVLEGAGAPVGRSDDESPLGDTETGLPRTAYAIFEVEFRVSGSKFQVSSFRFRVSSFEFQIPSSRFQVKVPGSTFNFQSYLIGA